MRKALWRAAGAVLAAVLLVGGPAWGSFGDDVPSEGKMDPWLSQQFASSQDGSSIMVFVHGTSLAEAEKAAKGTGLQLVDSFESVGVVAAVGKPDQVARVSQSFGVTYVEGNRPIEMFMETSHRATRGVEARAGFTGSPGVDGSGVGIAIVDSGIDGTHPMFRTGGGSRVVRNVKLVCQETAPAYLVRFPPSGPFPPSTCNDQTSVWVDLTELGNDTDNASAGGHGTHVAGIAGGGDVTTKDGRHLQGAAPGSTVVGVSIGTSLSIYGGGKGLEWVLQNHASPCAGCPAIKVVNNSWGLSGGGTYDPRAFVSKIQDQLVAAGVAVVWANGNDGGDGTVNRSSVFGQSLTPGVISVANYFDGDVGDRDGALDSSSSRGLNGSPTTYPDVSAPGSLITSACRATLTICGTGLFFFDGDDPDYATISGTSMAAPHVTGIVAQLFQAKPAATPAEIEDALEDTAHKFTAAGRYEADPLNSDNTTSYDKGHGLVDVVGAVADLRQVAPLPAVDSCGTGQMIVDESGDATGAASVSRTSSLPSQPSLDILGGNMSWLPGATPASTKVQFTISVDNLGNPSLSTGSSFNFYFTHNKKEMNVTANRSSSGAYTFSLTGDRGPDAAQLSGSADEATDTITISLPSSGVTPTVTADTAITKVRIWSRRQAGALAPVADEALSDCAFKGGVIASPGGALDPLPEVGEVPEPGSTLTVTSPAMSWRGSPTTNISDLFGCDGFYEDERECEKRHVEIIPSSAGGYLSVDVSADNPADDFDLYIYGPDGQEVGRSATPGGIEAARVPIPERGVYTIEVIAYLTAEGEYAGAAELQSVAPAPAGVPVLTVGSDGAWSGTIPLASSYLGCNSDEDPACHNRQVYFDVPDGGALLTINVLSTDADNIDIDVSLRNESGQRVANGATRWGEETISYFVELDGLYTISVSSFFYLGQTYSGSAILTV